MTYYITHFRRTLQVDGLIQYPFSTREQVAVVKHLQKYPEDSVSDALENVVSYDRADGETFEVISKVFNDRGLPLSTKNSGAAFVVNLQHPETLPEPEYLNDVWKPLRDPILCEITDHGALKTFDSTFQYDSSTLEKNDSLHVGRGRTFGAEMSRWTVPLGSGRLVDAVVSPSGSIHVMTSHPHRIHSFNEIEEFGKIHILNADASLGGGCANTMHIMPSGSLLVSAASYGLLHWIDPSNVKVRGVLLPESFTGVEPSRSPRMARLKRSLRSTPPIDEYNVCGAGEKEGKSFYVFHMPGTNRILWTSFDAESSCVHAATIELE